MSRKGFEIWLRDTIPNVSLERDSDDKENYFDDIVQLAWEAWQQGSKSGTKAGKFRAIFAKKRRKGSRPVFNFHRGNYGKS